MEEPPTTTLPTISKVFEPPLLYADTKEGVKVPTNPRVSAERRPKETLERKESSKSEKGGMMISSERKSKESLSRTSKDSSKTISKPTTTLPKSQSKISPEGKSRIPKAETQKQNPSKVDPRKISNEIKMKALDLSKKSLTESDMKELGGLLYRFNYTLKYNGHNENGYLSGGKDGRYFILGEDGIKRIIEYMANEFGYQPHIKLEDLEEPSSKEENNLLGYEFVWF